MGEDENFGHIVPLLRRIIILVAVITAIPVVLWTITAFVRTYVSPPKIPTFHQLAASASADQPLDIKPPQTMTAAAVSPAKSAKTSEPNTSSAKPSEIKPSQPMSVTVATAAADASMAPKGPFLGDHAPEQATNAPAASATVASAQPISATPMNAPAASLPKLADTSPTAPAPAIAAETPAAPAAEPGAATAALPSNALAAQKTAAAAASDATADALPAVAPLSGPVPLPRHRPHELGEVRMAAMAPITPASVPMPRPRPDTAGPGAPATDTGSGGPLDFLSNIFGGGK
jgi:hypothetical protein